MVYGGNLSLSLRACDNIQQNNMTASTQKVVYPQIVACFD